MKNPMVFYATIAVGVLALIAGVLFITGHLGHRVHHILGYGGIGVGVLLIVAGIAAMVVLKPKANVA